MNQTLATTSLSDTLQVSRKRLAHDPDDVEALQAYAEALMAVGRVAEGAALFQRVIASKPKEPELNYGLLWNLHYLPGYDRRFFQEQYTQWAPRVFDVSWSRHHVNPPHPQRRLRLGIVSGSFLNNSVMSPFELVVEHLDPEAFEVVGYGHVPVPDDATERWRSLCSIYRAIDEVSDEQAAQWVRDDGIDILLEVGGYCRGSRLGVFALKPAPIQVDLGGLTTLGLPQIDVRITDPLLDPPGTDRYYLERLVRLSPMCPFVPPAPCPDVTDLPALTRGCVTLGCFNNNRKINDVALRLWGEILRRLPDARLIFKCPDGRDPAVQSYYRSALTHAGIEPDRIDILGSMRFSEHLQCLSQCDLMLDTYPYNAARGTMEALWMGVPTVTYTGDLWISRVGRMLHQHVGLEIFAAYSEQEYVDKAVSFAGQLQELQTIRRSLRRLMRASDLCDVKGWTRRFERALRDMWMHWCRETV